jgi:signal peptidase II
MGSVKVSETDQAVGKPAWRCRWAYVIFIFTSSAGLVLDLWTKRQVCLTFGDPIKGYLREPAVLIENYVQFYTRLNSGAVWSVASGQRYFLLATSIAAMIFLGWLFFTIRADQRWGQAALGMLAGGALGNMYDRIFNDGRVVDFIEVNLHFWPANPWPIFNVADILLCAGVAMLLLSMMKSHSQKKGEKQNNT